MNLGVNLPKPTDLISAALALPESVVLLNRSLTNLAQTVARLDALVQRLDRVTEPLEEPLTALAPRLEALLPLLDEEMLANLPVVIDSVNRNAIPALEALGQTQAQVASISASVQRLTGMMEETFSRLVDLPGFNLVNKLRGDRLERPERERPPAGRPGSRGEED